MLVDFICNNVGVEAPVVCNVVYVLCTELFCCLCNNAGLTLAVLFESLKIFGVVAHCKRIFFNRNVGNRVAVLVAGHIGKQHVDKVTDGVNCAVHTAE